MVQALRRIPKEEWDALFREAKAEAAQYDAPE
jgi:hypothetical protein